MPIWKVLFTLAFGGVCFALALATIVVPLALTAEEHKWLWTAGVFLSTVLMGTLFTLFLRSADRAFVQDVRRKY